MKTIAIHMATDDQSTPVVVEIVNPIPILGNEEALFLIHSMQADAKILAKALRQALPGGTFDRLLIELLQYQAGELIRSYAHWDQPAEVAS